MTACGASSVEGCHQREITETFDRQSDDILTKSTALCSKTSFAAAVGALLMFWP